MTPTIHHYMWAIYAISSAIIWGLDYCLTEHILKENLSPITLLLFEALLAIVIFSFATTKLQIKNDFHLLTTKPKLSLLVLFISLTINLGNLFVFLAIREKNATFAALVELAYPIFTIFFTWLIFRTYYLTFSTLVGSILIFCGVFLLIF